jgi:hypothetical protein
MLTPKQNDCLERTGNHVFFQDFACWSVVRWLFGQPLRLVLSVSYTNGE